MLLRAFWLAATPGAPCLAAGPVNLGLVTLSQVGQAAVYGGALLQVLIGIAWFRAEVGETGSLLAPYIAAWVLVFAGFALQLLG